MSQIIGNNRKIEKFIATLEFTNDSLSNLLPLTPLYEGPSP